MTHSTGFKLTIALLLIFIICTACQSNKEQGGGELITLTELKSLSEKGAALNWSDFDKYVFEDIGSGVYIRKYQVEGERQLVVSGKSLEQPPEKISVVDSSGKELEMTPENVEGTNR